MGEGEREGWRGREREGGRGREGEGGREREGGRGREREGEGGRGRERQRVRYDTYNKPPCSNFQTSVFDSGT